MFPRKKKNHPWAVLFAAICIAVVLGAGGLMLIDGDLSFGGSSSRPVYEPISFAGDIKAFTIANAALEYATGEPSRENHKAALVSILDFAVDNEYDAVLYQVFDGEEYYCRVNDSETAEYIKKCDKLFDKWDPLAYFCEEASARGLGVFALYNEANEELAKQVEEKYALGGSFVKGDGNEDIGAAAIFTGIGGEGTLIQPTLSASYYLIDKLPLTENYFGLIAGAYEEAQLNESTLMLWQSIKNEVQRPEPLNFAPANELALTYPIDTKAAIYTKTCFLMGTSDPSQPLSLDGVEVLRLGQSGAFGVLVELKTGANKFVLSQGERQLAFTLTRKSYTGGGGTTGAADGTVSAQKGQMIEISSGIAGALYEFSADGNITDTFKKGAKAIVAESVRTTRNGKKTWAYKLASGDYVLARNARILPETEMPSFTLATSTQGERGEKIAISAQGTPAAYTKYENNILTITFLDTKIDAGFAISDSQMISDCAVRQEENGAATLELTMKDALWGWDINYKDGKTEIFLKYTPKASTEKGKPLAGVSVMLDAGHGEYDGGAMGVGGQNAPVEKHVNLAVANAAKYYLEKLGATVLLTRADDTFKTLDERLAAQSELQPDFFVSVHHNSLELTSDANKSTGTECYYFFKHHDTFARVLSDKVSAATLRVNRGEKYGYFYVTRTTVAPSVLLEVGFMVNPLEYEDITNDVTIAKTGESVAMSVYEIVMGNGK